MLVLFWQNSSIRKFSSSHASGNEFGNPIYGRLYGLINQTETLFQYRINCIIGRCRGISKPRDLYIFLSPWNLACGSAPTCQISEQFDIWSTQSHDFKSYEEELTYGLMFDIARVCTLNIMYPWKLVQAKCDNASSIVKNRMLDKQFETKIEKAILDSISIQFHVNEM